MKRLFSAALIPSLLLCALSARSSDSLQTAREDGGTFSAGNTVISGRTTHPNIVPGSVQIVAGDDAWDDDGNGHLVCSTIRHDIFATTVGSAEKKDWLFVLPHKNVSNLTVEVGSIVCVDDGNGSLTGVNVADSSIDYAIGLVFLKLMRFPELNTPVRISYTYAPWGDGVIQYSSGAWRVGPGTQDEVSIDLTYSYYVGKDGDGNAALDSASGRWFVVADESAGTLGEGGEVHSGTLSHPDVVPGSVQIVAGDGVWNDDGNGHLVCSTFQHEIFTTTTGSTEKKNWFFDLPHKNVRNLTMEVGSIVCTDDGNGNLTGTKVVDSSIDYAMGHVSLSLGMFLGPDTPVRISYSYAPWVDGVIQYSSGAWSVSSQARISSPLAIRAVYGYFTEIPAVKTYSVKFNANGGKLPKGKKMAAQKMTYGKTAKLRRNVYVREGYVFIGWSLKKKGPVAFKNAASVKNLTAKGGTVKLYAQWAKKSYKVKFVANGGKGGMALQSFKYGKAQKLSANKFKRKGYVFKGWAKSKALAKKGKVAYKNKKKVKNLVRTGKTVKLYAVWKKK